MKKDPGLTLNKTICAFGYKLKCLSYLKPEVKDNDLTAALTQLFRVDISKQNFSQAQKYFTNGNAKAEDYLSHFHFLNR